MRQICRDGANLKLSSGTSGYQVSRVVNRLTSVSSRVCWKVCIPRKHVPWRLHIKTSLLFNSHRRNCLHN